MRGLLDEIVSTQSSTLENMVTNACQKKLTAGQLRKEEEMEATLPRLYRTGGSTVAPFPPLIP
jgi:hypothetical protein